MLKAFILGIVVGVVLIFAGAWFYFSTGRAPVAAGDPPMPFEKRLAKAAQHARIENRSHEWNSSALPEARAQIAGADVPVRPMNGSAIDHVFSSDDVAAKYQVICTHEYARTVIDAAHDQSSGPGSMAIVDDARDPGGRPALPAPDARDVEMGPLTGDRRLGADECSKHYWHDPHWHPRRVANPSRRQNGTTRPRPQLDGAGASYGESQNVSG